MSPSSEASTSKEAWRAQFRSYRRSQCATAYAARSTLIAHRALGIPAVAQAEMIHCYWPLIDQGEIDTRLFISACRSRGIEIVLPVITSFDPDSPTLEHRRYTGPQTLTRNRWGIFEPQGTENVPPECLDLVIVPALGADRQGTRMGQGAGYYDAFLASVDCPRIALVYDACVVRTLPSASHDVPMTALVSESGVHHVDV